MISQPKLHLKQVCGHPVGINENLGHLVVYHDGTVTWDVLQEIKNTVWGPEARAIEVYPAQSRVVNSVEARHLWRLGSSDFCPDLLGDFSLNKDESCDTSLEERSREAWKESEEIFKHAIT